jgi:hypothetical protein
MKFFILMLVAASATAQAQRDPFARPALAPASHAPAGEAAVPRAAPQLRAIMYEPGKSLVNIDGRILAVGDRLDDYSLSAIGERSATLTRRGARLVLVLDQESSK